jgi:hypothetical protein
MDSLSNIQQKQFYLAKTLAKKAILYDKPFCSCKIKTLAFLPIAYALQYWDVTLNQTLSDCLYTLYNLQPPRIPVTPVVNNQQVQQVSVSSLTCSGSDAILTFTVPLSSTNVTWTLAFLVGGSYTGSPTNFTQTGGTTTLVCNCSGVLSSNTNYNLKLVDSGNLYPTIFPNINTPNCS